MRPAITDFGYRVLSGLFSLAVACFLLAGVHAPARATVPLPCCDGTTFSAAVNGWLGHGPGLAIVVEALLVIGVSSLAFHGWRTHRRINQLLRLIGGHPPASLSRLLVEMDLAAHVDVIQTSQPLAFCYGFLRPRICLSTGLLEMLSPLQTRAVLLHEDRHRQRYDPTRFLLAEAVRAMLFFLPAVHEWVLLLKVNLELEADRYAIMRVGEAPMAGVLYRLLSQSPGENVLAGATTAGFSVNAVRIAALLGERDTPCRVSSRSLLTSTVLLTILCLLSTNTLL